MNLSQDERLSIVEKIKKSARLTTDEFDKLQGLASSSEVNFCKELYEVFLSRVRTYLKAIHEPLSVQLQKKFGYAKEVAPVIADDLSIQYAYLSLSVASNENAVLFRLITVLQDDIYIPLGFRSFLPAIIESGTAIESAFLREWQPLAAIQTTVFEKLMTSWLLYQAIGIEQLQRFDNSSKHSLIPELLLECLAEHAKFIQQHKKLVDEQEKAALERDEKIDETLKKQHQETAWQKMFDDARFVPMLYNLMAYNLQISLTHYNQYCCKKNLTADLHYVMDEIFNPTIGEKKCHLNQRADLKSYCQLAAIAYTDGSDSIEKRKALREKEQQTITLLHDNHNKFLLWPALPYIGIDASQTAAAAKREIAEQLHSAFQKKKTAAEERLKNAKTVNEQAKKAVEKNKQQVIADFVNQRQKLTSYFNEARKKIGKNDKGFNFGISMDISMDVKQDEAGHFSLENTDYSFRI